MSYKIIKASSPEKLERLVNSYLKNGYECKGGITPIDSVFCQTVTKKKMKRARYHSSHVPFGMDF